MAKKQMIVIKTWEEFRKTGLLWFINRTLHLFGWAIICEVDDNTNMILKVYPARVKFRGFDESSETEEFKKVTKYLDNNIKDLLKEVKD